MGPTSPLSRSGKTSDHRYYDPPRLPHVRLRFVRFSLSSPDTLLCPSFVFVSPTFGGLTDTAGTSVSGRDFVIATGYPTPSSLRRETYGPLKFPGCPHDCMPCSQTPVVSRTLAITRPGLPPSDHSTSSAFPLGFPKVYPNDHDYTHFGAQSHSLQSRSIRLRTPVTGFALGSHFRPVGQTLAGRDFLNPTPRQALQWKR